MVNLVRPEVEIAKNKSLGGSVDIILPPKYIGFLVIILFFILTLLIFSMSFSYSQKLTINGYVLPQKKAVVLHSSNINVIQSVFVLEGQKVKKGETILRTFSDEFGQNGRDKYLKKINFLNNKVNQQQEKLKKEFKQYKKDLINNKKELTLTKEKLLLLIQKNTIKKERIANKKAQLTSSEELRKTGYISKVEFLRQTDSIDIIREQLIQTNIDVVETKKQIEGLKTYSSFLERDYRRLHSSLNDEIESSELELSLTQLNRTQDVKSPINGTIEYLPISVGQELGNYEVLVKILPEHNEFEGVFYISPNISQKFHLGQKISIRYEELPINEYGVYSGVVYYKSKTPVLFQNNNNQSKMESETLQYLIKVKLEKQFVQQLGASKSDKIKLSKGHHIQGNVILDTKSIFQTFFNSFFKSKI